MADKDKKKFAADLKTIYHPPSEITAHEKMLEITEKLDLYYPNAIESLSSTYRRLNPSRSVFPSDTVLLKVLYLSSYEATKKWSMTVRNWGKVYGELSIMFDGCI